MKRLEEIKYRVGCLLPRPGAEVPACHEFTLCDCEILRLVRCLEMALESFREAGDYEMLDAIEKELS